MTDKSLTATTSGAREHARAQAGTVVEAMPTIPATMAVDLPDGVAAESVVWDETVAGGGYTHKVIARGTELRITDLEGDACAHLVLFHATDPWERLNVADTVKVQWQAYLGVGSLLLSDQGRVMASIIDDTSGSHDAICGSSTRRHNEDHYGAATPESGAPCARDLFGLALAKHGLELRDLPPSVAFFKGVTVERNGDLHLRAGGAPGPTSTHVTVRAELPLIVAIANVPHVLDPRLDYTVTPLRVTAWRERPTEPGDELWTSSPEAERAFLNTDDLVRARAGLPAGVR